jgi:hypothetical protein
MPGSVGKLLLDVCSITDTTAGGMPGSIGTKLLGGFSVTSIGKLLLGVCSITGLGKLQDNWLPLCANTALPFEVA